MRSLSLLLLAACGASPETDAILAAKAVVGGGVDDLVDAAEALQAAAPTPDDDGWSASADAAALDAMRAAWKDARTAYERVEGAIAELFPDLDASTDERYDGFLAEGADPDLFDGEGVTGVHAIERILWADAIPAEVEAFESTLTGYVAAAFPADATQAGSFRDGLVQRLVDDTHAMRDAFEPLALDAAAAYGGVVGSMAEQTEKIALGATGEAESRYARHTLADMRANLAGGLDIYEAFSPWILSTPDGDALDGAVRDGFARVAAAYDALPGDALPEVPATWSPDDPTEADLATPYGTLWTLLLTESDPGAEGSLVAAMVAAGAAIGVDVAL
ncbi:MAG: EfeM/EfeO family lipoprotein [Alphaproteobacteria bacterium]|nr:EfeM/EfeO family lipoprotein [Alphaproteobacteria bacterium]